MNPKRRKELVKEYALESGEDEELVDKVIRAYYGRVQKSLSRCEHTAVDVPKLGVFYAVGHRIDKKIERLSSMFENIDPTKSLRSYSTANEIRNQLITLNNLKEKVDLEQERKKEIRRQRYEKDRTSENS